MVRLIGIYKFCFRRKETSGILLYSLTVYTGCLCIAAIHSYGTILKELIERKPLQQELHKHKPQ
jgi:hypothetical protein